MLEAFSCKVALSLDWTLLLSNVFPYGAVEITSLETNKVFKVNEYRLKTFYEGWTT